MDKLRVALETRVFPTREEGNVFINNFMDMANIARKSCMGQQSLEGNKTRKFLKSLERLRAAYMGRGMLAATLPYIYVLESFAAVVADFRLELPPNYENSIAKFSALYRKLPLSVASNVHILMLHAVEYIKTLSTISWAL